MRINFPGCTRGGRLHLRRSVSTVCGSAVLALAATLGGAQAQSLTASPDAGPYGNPTPRGGPGGGPTITLQPNVDARFINLTNFTGAHGDITGAQFTGANLAGLNLSNLSFSEAPTLRFANLSNVVINVARPGQGGGYGGDGAELLRQAGNVRGITLRNARLNDPRLIGRDLTGADFSGSDFRFGDAQARNNAFLNANLRHVDLSGVTGDIRLSTVLLAADIRGVGFNAWQFRSGDSFAGRDVSGASFDGARLRPGLFGNADLSGASFYRAELEVEAFRGTKLQNVSFVGAENFDPVILRRAGLSNFDLAPCRAESCRTDNLVGIDLTGVNLRGADLRGLNLDGARLDITGARVDHTTSLKGATLLNLEQLPTAQIEERLRSIGLGPDRDDPRKLVANDNLVGVRLQGIVVDRALLTTLRFKEEAGEAGFPNPSPLNPAIFTDSGLRSMDLSGIDVPSFFGATLYSDDVNEKFKVSADTFRQSGPGAPVSSSKDGTNLAWSDLRQMRLRSGELRVLPMLSYNELQTVGFSGKTFDDKPLANDNLIGLRLDLYVGSLARLNLTDAVFSSPPPPLESIEGKDNPIRITDITGTNLTRADLRYAVFLNLAPTLAEGAILVDADLRHVVDKNGDQFVTAAFLRKVGMTKTGQTSSPNENLRGIRLGPVDLSDGDLSRLKLARADFASTAFGLRGGDFDRAGFSGADLRGTEFDNAKLFGAVFRNAQVDSRTSFRQADLRETIGLTTAMLRTVGTDEFGTPDDGLLGIQFNRYGGMDLSGLYLSDRYARADFSTANLTSGADFTGALLSGALFADSQLRDTRFVRADLREADFRGADADAAEFKNAQLQGALFDYRTLLPDYFDTRAAGMSFFLGKETVVATEANPDDAYAMHDRTILQGGTFVAPRGLILDFGQTIEGYGTVATEGRVIVNNGLIDGDADNGGLWVIGDVSGQGAFGGLVNLLGTLSVEAGQTMLADKLWLHRGSTLRLGFDGVSLGRVQANTFWLDGTLEIDLSGFGQAQQRQAPMMMRATFTEDEFAPMQMSKQSPLSFFDLLFGPSMFGSFSDIVFTGLDPAFLSSLEFIDEGDGFTSLRLIIRQKDDGDPDPDPNPEPGQVSEPATLALLGAGLFGMLALRRRRSTSGAA